MREVSRGAVALRGEPPVGGVAGRGAASGSVGEISSSAPSFRGANAGFEAATPGNGRLSEETKPACRAERPERPKGSCPLRRRGPERGAPIVASPAADLDAADNRELPPLHYAARRENYAAFAATARRKPFQGRAGSAIRGPGRARRPVNLRISGADPAANHPPGRSTPSRMERPYGDQAQTGIRHGPFRRVPQPVRMKDAQARKA